MKHFDPNAEEKVVKVHGIEFSVYSDGSVKMLRNQHMTKRRFGNKTYKGYMAVNVHCDDGEHTIFVHRLVAMAFVDNPDGKPQVNHIDGDKTNNSKDNLEWCTNEENMWHKANVLKVFSSKSPVMCMETGEVYETQSEAARTLGIPRAGIWRSIKDPKRFSSGGYHWKKIVG